MASTSSTSHRSPALLAVGSYTEAYGSFRAKGEGVTLLAIDADSGRIEVLDRLALGPNPAYLRWRSADVIHAVLEANDARAGIVTLGVDPHAPRLRLLHRLPLEGTIPCHLDVDPTGRWLAAACYGSGHISVHGLAEDRPGTAAVTIRHRGGSIHPERQTGPHPHATRFSPEGHWLVVPDLGTDEVVCYPFDAARGQLAQPYRFKAPAGSGPRLVLFSRGGDHVILVEELASTVASLRWRNGALEPVSSSATTDVRPNTAAGLRWHPSGEIFGVSNRGADTIALFRFESQSGAITHLASVPSGGVKPRDFDFSPCGRWLIASNQDSDSVVLHAIEVGAGVPCLRQTGIRVPIASPTCVRFLNQPAACLR
ncbi:MAG: lactonase family protein [Proteobacteria bacterium]|nr:lactonase family protein [Pseudomonadota bacterium]MBI3496435.1 lactonase family protein [Pseudomonadota bacterium]